MRPRIALIAASPDIIGGQAIQARALLDGLRGEGYEASFIPINPAFPRRLRWLRRYPYLRTLVNQTLYLPSLLRLRHADVAHVFSASYWSFLLAPVPAILAARALGKRIVLHYHSGEAEDHLARWGALVHPWLRLVDQLVVPSEYLKKVFAGHGYQAHVIPNLVDLSRFRYRDRMPLRPRLLSTRNLDPYYCVDNTLEAFALVKCRYPDATLDVAGYGREEGRLRRLAASLESDGIRFLGRIEPDALPGLCNEADIFVNSSVVDNQPVSILEAFAAGLPVVSTWTGDIRTMVHNGETGLLVPPGDPAATAKAITSLLEDPDQAVLIARRAREEAARYTWLRAREEWAAVYAGPVARTRWTLSSTREALPASLRFAQGPVRPGHPQAAVRLETVAPSEWTTRLLPAWSALLEEASEPSVFLTPEWIGAWWRAYGQGREAKLVAAWDEEDRLVGLAPLYIRRVRLAGLPGPRVIRIMGHEAVGSEYLGLLARPGLEEELVSALAKALEGSWALLDFRGLREGEVLARLIPDIVGAPAPRRVHRERDVCSQILLPGDYDAYLRSLDKGFRAELRSHTEKLVKTFAVRLVLTSREDELGAQLDRFFALHQARWRTQGQPGAFGDPRKRGFYREMVAGFLRRGWLRFYHLEVDGVIRASQFGFAYNRAFHSLQEAFDHTFRLPGARGLGVVLRGMVIRESIAEGLKAYDFLGGGEEYKARWGATTHYVQRVRIGAPGPTGALAFAATAGWDKARDWARTRLPGWLLKARRVSTDRRQAASARCGRLK